MYAGAKILLLYLHLAEMLDIWVSNRAVDILFRLGRITERKELLSRYVLLKRIRRANLELVRHGYLRHKVDAPEFAQFIARCRSDTLAYLRKNKHK